MNDLENYKIIIENIFGKGIARFEIKSDSTNNIIGALNHQDFDNFKASFKERLKRLNEIYKANNKNREEIISKVNLIADKNNWEGAYSELVAYDFLNKEKNFLPQPIKLNNSIAKNKTFAEQIGKKEANLDGFFENYSVYFEVKSLKDNVSDILNGIYKELKKKINFNDLMITHEYPAMDISYEVIKENREQLLDELQKNIDISKRTTFVKSRVVNGLNFRILWGRGVLLMESTYDPYRHAENYYRIVFNYIDKFVKDRPFFLVFVVFPWFNGIITEFRNSNKIFYRAFARRVFCSYINKADQLKSICPNFKGDETIFTISKKLSGILFLEDKSIKSANPRSINIKSYFYFNPNADNPLMDSLFENVISNLELTESDDFKHDNY